MSAGKILAKFDRGRNFGLITESYYEGKSYIDIREWYKDQKGEDQPTKKGISILKEKFTDFVTAVETAEAGLGKK